MRDRVRQNMQLYLVVLLVMVSILLLGGTSYALVQKVIRGNTEYSLKTGDFTVKFKETKTLSLTNEKTVYDNVGMSSGDEFVFSVTNDGDYRANYSIKIIETSADNLEEVIRYAVDFGDGYLLDNVHALSNNQYIVQNRALDAKSSDTYRLRFWLDIDASEQYINKEFSGKVVLDATQDTYKYATNVIEAIYNKADKEGLLRIGLTGDVYTSGRVREYRYHGNINTNYVWFNCEEGYREGLEHCERWRIIGSFTNNTNNGLSNYQVLKIVRDESLDKQAFNTNNLGDFKTSTIREYLNNDYYNKLSDQTKKMIMKSLWSYGSVSLSDTIIDSYNKEKKNTLYENIGLLSASDYGYAGDSKNYDQKYEVITNNDSNNWLYRDDEYMLINTDDLEGNKMYYINLNGITMGNTIDAYAIRPVVYLTPDVSIGNGVGTKDNPYELVIKYPIELGTKTDLKIK